MSFPLLLGFFSKGDKNDYFFPPSYNNDLKNLITYVVFLSLEFKLRYVFSLKILKLLFYLQF